MPSSIRHREAPVLFEEKKAGWFHHDKVLVNYRVHGRWYVVDRGASTERHLLAGWVAVSKRSISGMWINAKGKNRNRGPG